MAEGRDTSSDSDDDRVGKFVNRCIANWKDKVGHLKGPVEIT